MFDKCRRLAFGVPAVPLRFIGRQIFHRWQARTRAGLRRPPANETAPFLLTASEEVWSRWTNWFGSGFWF